MSPPPSHSLQHLLSNDQKMVGDENKKQPASIAASLQSSHSKKAVMINTDLLQRIHSFHHRLRLLESLSPSTTVNMLFAELVGFVIRGNHLDAEFIVLSASKDVQKVCEEIRMISAEAASQLELHWSNLLVNDGRCLADFPYYDNYLDLVRLEHSLLCGVGVRPQHTLFIGSGPFPLSSMLLASQHIQPTSDPGDWSIVNVDNSPQAIKFGSSMLEKVLPALSGQISFLERDAANIEPQIVRRSDFICIAALVGQSMDAKQKIVRSLTYHMKIGSRLMLRSAHGVRCLLYPNVDEVALLEAAEGRLELEIVCHPRNAIVNSVVIARRV